MKALILSCSLNSHSFGASVGEYIKHKYPEFELLLIGDCDFSLCEGFDGASFENPKLKDLQDQLMSVDGVVLIAPIYNFDVSASCKNLLDLLSKPYKDILTGKSLRHKTMGFIGTSALPNCYLAPLNFLANTMLAHDVFMVPKHIMLMQDETPEKYARHVDKLIHNFINITLALKDFNQT